MRITDGEIKSSLLFCSTVKSSEEVAIAMHEPVVPGSNPNQTLPNSGPIWNWNDTLFQTLNERIPIFTQTKSNSNANGSGSVITAP